MASAKVADLTIDELRGLIRDVMSETLRDVLDDPDQGLEIRAEMMAQIRRSLANLSSTTKTHSADEVAARLGLEW